jgi:uncharacterized protein YjiS (DUF1127 family)
MILYHILEDKLSFVNRAHKANILDTEVLFQEMKMTASIHHMMINNHGPRAHAPRAYARALDEIRLWQRRAQQRRELARWTDRDLHDVGVSWSTVATEVSKPFWRA